MTVTAPAPAAELLRLGDGRTATIKGTADEPRIGITIVHQGCPGVRLLLDSKFARDVAPHRARHDVMSKPGQPLTLHPEIVCECGEVGYIRDGEWVPSNG